uniref:(northern house mosquito) hypothetical protein n=1 Tax=Culex pipiens TaxID=7175 RepID=A0A8D8F3F2_CULPI
MLSRWRSSCGLKMLLLWHLRWYMLQQYTHALRLSGEPVLLHTMHILFSKSASTSLLPSAVPVTTRAAAAAAPDPELDDDEPDPPPFTLPAPVRSAISSKCLRFLTPRVAGGEYRIGRLLTLRRAMWLSCCS